MKSSRGAVTIVVAGESQRIRADLEKIAPVTVVGGKFGGAEKKVK